MAKLSGYQCDRCGAPYEKNRAKDSQGRCDYNLVGVGLINTAGQLFRTDLCDECMAELQSWLDDPAMEVRYIGGSDDLSDEEE